MDLRQIDELFVSEKDKDFITEFLVDEQNTLKKTANIKKRRTEINKKNEQQNVFTLPKNNSGTETDDELFVSEKEEEDFITEFLMGEQNTIKKTANVKQRRTEITKKNKQKNDFTLLKNNNGAETDDELFVSEEEEQNFFIEEAEENLITYETEDDFIEEFLVGKQNIFNKTANEGIATVI